jgi:putative membrane protein
MIDYSDYISVFFIWYVPMVIFTFFVFDILGVKKVYSIIPIYNIYRLLSEYQGRVWKRNWGLCWGILCAIMVMQFFESELIAVVLFIFSLILIPLYLFTLVSLLIVIYLPLLRNVYFKLVLLLNILLPIIVSMIKIFAYGYVYKDNLEILIIVSKVIINYFYVFAAFDIWLKVKKGKYVVNEKLDYSNLSSRDIEKELEFRGRVLVHPVEQTEKLESKIELNEENGQLENLN